MNINVYALKSNVSSSLSTILKRMKVSNLMKAMNAGGETPISISINLAKVIMCAVIDPIRKQGHNVFI